jgi:hypothetical protein
MDQHSSSPCRRHHRVQPDKIVHTLLAEDKLESFGHPEKRYIVKPGNVFGLRQGRETDRKYLAKSISDSRDLTHFSEQLANAFFHYVEYAT